MLTRIRETGKYKGLEIAFFLFIFFLFPVLTDVEYRINEEPCQSCDNRFIVQLIERLISGFFSMWPWIFFYYFMLNKQLLENKFRSFALSTIFFFIGLEFYTVYVYYWPVSKMEFLPEYIFRSHARYFKSKPLVHFSFIYILSRMLVFMALAYFIKTIKQEQKLKAIQYQKLASDIKYLKAQMEPHFFFNTLNNVYSLALQGSKETAPLVARLSDLMRYVVYESKEELVKLEKELEFVRNYISVQSIRYSDKINIRFNIENVDEGYKIQPMILLPFFENAFKHGIEEEVSEGFVTGRVYMVENTLYLTITNSVPFQQKKNKLPGGIGLSNTRERLDLLYPKCNDLQIKDCGGQYSISLKLTLER